MARTTHHSGLAGALSLALLVTACGGAATPTVAPAGATPTPGATTPDATPGESLTAQPVGAATVTGPDAVEVGTKFDVAWTGPSAAGDYVTIVAAGAAKWTNEPYFYTTTASPGSLIAPSKPGPYALWYVSGTDETILARRAISVTAFVGSVDGPATVEAGTTFNASWTGPNGPGDYVTILAVGTVRWSNESYFYTEVGGHGSLVSPITPGAYELCYAFGADNSIQVRNAITVTPFVVTLSAPASVAAGSKFQVAWTGPNGPSDYITIVAAGSPPGTYNSYAYTAGGTPVTIEAPTTPGPYEIWYASDRVDKFVFKSIPITVK